MARPSKTEGGISYFSLDCDFFRDEKIRRIKAQCGMKGIGFLIWLLCDLYEGEGYYKKFTYDDCALLADSAGGGVGAETVREVVKSSLKCGLFEKQVFEKYGVLTSSRIQENYLRACERRSAVFIDRRYWLDPKKVKPSTLVKVTLLDVIDGNNRINVDVNSVNADENPINIKNKNIYTYYGEYRHVQLTEEEYSELIRLYGSSGADKRIRMLDLHMEQHKDSHSDNHFLTLTRGWVQRAIERDAQRKQSSEKQNPGKPKRSKPGAAFHDFEQREYDYNELMRQIREAQG